jgi:cell shape-determining protein MreD
VRRTRLVAAAATILTMLLLQATLIGPVVGSWPVSLPAVVVAAVAFVDGPATGMSLGFVAGLVADLGSGHPAGVLALCWLGIGLVCGRVVDRHTVRHDAVSAGVICGVLSTAAALLLLVLHTSGSVTAVLAGFVPAIIGDTVLGVVVVALVRRMLDSDRLRHPAAVYTELAVGTRR